VTLSPIESEALAGLVARQEIWECLLRYARGVDRVDEGLIRSAFWEDAVDAHGRVTGSPEDFLGWFLPAQPDREVAQHLLMNHRLQLDGASASAETYFISVAKPVDSDRIEQVGGRYLDRFQRRNGQWRIAHRLVLLDWQSVGDASGMAARLSHSHRGFRDRNDPSYVS
jgi:hypothetical protein